MKTKSAIIVALLLLPAGLPSGFGTAFAQTTDDIPPAADNSKTPDTELALSVMGAKSQFVPLDAGRVQRAQDRVVMALTRLQTFLEKGTRGQRDGWYEFLNLSSLSEELTSGGMPRWQPLLASYNKFNSGESGLQLPPFADVRESLESYLELLQLAETTEGRVEAGSLELKEIAGQFENYLASGGETKESGWKRYLGWESLSAGLEGAPDSEKLLGVYRKFSEKDVPGLEQPAFRRMARSLGKYLELEQMNKSLNAKDLFQRRLDRLAVTLRKHAYQPDNASAADLNGQLRWLDSTGYLPQVAAQVRRDFSHPNVKFTVSGDVVTENVARSVNECQPVSRYFEGSRVRGTAATTGHVYGVLLPSDNGIAMDIRLDGTTRTDTVAQQRKVHVSTVGTTLLNATKRVSITPDGIHVWPAVATATTTQQTTGVCIDRRCRAGNRLIRRVANRKAGESRCRAQNEQSCEARKTIARQMDQQVAEMVAKSNTQMQESMDRFDVDVRDFVEDIILRSTSHDVFGHAKVTAARFLAAPTVAPTVVTTGNTKFQLHQSAVNNVLARLLGGIKLDSDNIVKRLEENGMPVPEELSGGTSPDGDNEVEDEWWSLTFDLAQPATVTFDDNRVRVAIRGRRFERGAQEIKEPIEISASYQLEKTAANQLRAVREGDVQVDFLRSPGRLSTKQITYKTFIKRKTGSLFADSFSVDELPEGEMADRVREMVLTEIDATAGWITAGLGL